MSMTDIGIDLGTRNIVIYAKGKGVVIKEPNMVAYDKDADKIIAIGEEASQMMGRTQGNIVSIRPMRQGVISDYDVTEAILRHFVQKAMGRRAFRKPRISICLPSLVTEVERKAVESATYQAGAREVLLVKEPVAAAIGSGIDISKPFGNMIVDIGGGTTDIAVISLCDVAVATTLSVGGDTFDDAIGRYIRKNHSLFVGEQVAEEVKMKIGKANRRPSIETMEITGRNVITGLPKTVTINSDEVRGAIQDTVAQIVEAVHGVLEKTPPELAADIATRGIVLTGGGSQLTGLEEVIQDRTGINTMTAENPGLSVAIGTGQYTDYLEMLGQE